MGGMEGGHALYDDQQLGGFMAYAKVLRHITGKLPMGLDGQKIKVTVPLGIKGSGEHLQHHGTDATSDGMFKDQLGPFLGPGHKFPQLLPSFQLHPWELFFLFPALGFIPEYLS